MPSPTQLAFIASLAFAAYLYARRDQKAAVKAEDYFIQDATSSAALANVDFQQHLTTGTLSDNNGKLSGGQFY